MRGSPLTKTARLASYLAAHPAELPRYARHLLSTPIRARLPWFSWAAIDFLKTYLQPNMTVFEYGSGGSTLFFSDRVEAVTSVEDVPEWHALIARRIKDEGLTVDYRLSAPGNAHIETLTDPYNVIVVDGSEDWPDHIVRPAFFAHAEKFVIKGGIIIVDDAWRYDELISKKANRREFTSTGPCRPGVTRTDIYFY
jgi:hypothetical protein